MLVNSWHFLLVTILAVLVTRGAGSIVLRNGMLLAFNGYFIARFIETVPSAVTLALLLVGIYGVGMARRRLAGAFPAAALVVLLLGLWAFLFLAKDHTLLGAANPFHHMPVAIIGISYMVFRSISYLMECGETEGASFFDYLNYMLFFPTILAGPIERYKPFVEQLNRQDTDELELLPVLHRIANGFIKKFAIADNLAAFSAAGIADPSAVSPLVLWGVGLGQLFLIYLDFSGYCDIVIGISRLMGFKVRENFDKSLQATNIQLFWERWHISMSSLMRDYVFTPICKAIITRTRREWQWSLIVTAYFFVMVLIALWHGTALGFLVFGILQGGALVLMQILMRRKKTAKVSGGPRVEDTDAVRIAKIAGTYVFVSLCLVLWMARDGQWLKFYAAMVGIR